MTGMQLVSLRLFNEETQETLSVSNPQRSFVIIEVSKEKLSGGGEAEMGKTYRIASTLTVEQRSLLESWVGMDLWISGLSRDGMVLQAKSQAEVKDGKLLVEIFATGGYGEDGHHTANLSFCKNAMAISKLDAHDGYVFFPFNREISVSSLNAIEVQELDVDMDVIAEHSKSKRHHIRTSADTMFLYIPEASRESARWIMMNMGKDALKYEDFNA